MRRVAGACVVMWVIGAWNLAGEWLVRPDVASDTHPFVVSTAESSAVHGLPHSTSSPPATTPAGRIIPATFARDPLSFLSIAPADSLDLLPGVGPVLAARIIEARAARGAFTSWDDVLAVKGIGPRTVARWQALHDRQ